MKTFVIVLPDQLFRTEEAKIMYSMADEVYLVEDSCYFIPASVDKRKKMRALMNDYKKYILECISDRVFARREFRMHENNRNSAVKYVSICKVLERCGENMESAALKHKSRESIPSFIEYFVGCGAMLEMFRPASFWQWGDRIRDTKYNGIGIRFHESPAFILSFDNVRCTNALISRRERIGFRKFVKELRGRFPWHYDEDLLNTVEPRATRNFTSTKDGEIYPSNAAQLIRIAEIMISGKFIRNVDDMFQVGVCLDYGIITPADLLLMLKDAKPAARRAAILYLIWREYLHSIYLVNSDLRFALGNKNRAANVDHQFKYSDITSILEVMEGRGSAWQRANTAMEMFINSFEWNTLPLAQDKKLRLVSPTSKMFGGAV